MVYARDSLLHDLTNESSDVVAFTNIVEGVFSKKPEAMIQRLNIFDTTICFVNAHLSHGKEAFGARCSNIKNIYENAFQKDKFGQVQDKNIQVSDQIYLFGNLHFRFNAADSLVETLCDGMEQKQDSSWDQHEIRRINELRAYDEVLIERDNNYFLSEFQESTISFGPTYKFNPKTQLYNSEKKYMMAWADRILYRTEDKVEVCKYGSLQQVKEATHM